jgi:predicted TIM-barrel fold metal-dependent hydrolase
MNRPLISADCHVTEPLDLWSSQLPASLRDRGPRIEFHDGRGAFMVEDIVAMKLPATPSRRDGGITRLDGVVSGHPGDDVEKRLSALEQDGVWAEVLYPHLAFFCAFEIRDVALQVGVCSIYNDWLSQTFSMHPRFAGVGLLPVRDLERALVELDRLPALQMNSALIPCHSDDIPYNEAHWEPLWERAADLGISLAFHVGTGRDQRPARGAGAAVVNYVVTLASAIETTSYLCASGVLERHPSLRIGMVECGAGWLAWTLEAMDDAYREHAAWVRPKLDALPSEYFRRQGFVTFQRDPVGLANIERTGSRCLLWGSDHPHPEGTFPHSQRAVAEQLGNTPKEIADAVLWRNAANLYGFEPPPGA